MRPKLALRLISTAAVLSAMSAAATLWAGQAPAAPAGGAPQQGAPAVAPAPGAAPARQDGGGRGRGGVAPQAYDDYTGFTKIWDGATLTNWNGESDVWSVVDGMLHADTTKTPGQHHIHYTGPGAVMSDFDLKVEFKLSAQGANGGIQYRGRLLHASHGGSIENPLGKPLSSNIRTFQQAIDAGLATAPAPRGGGAGNRGGGARGGGAPGGVAPAVPAPGGSGAAPGRGANAGQPAAPGPAPTPGPCTTGGVAVAAGVGPNGPSNEPNPWQVSGYQFDIDSPNGYTGQLYEGQGRGIVTAPGTVVELLPGRARVCLGVVAESPTSFIKPHLGLDGEWNQVQIIARGKTLIHMINGRVISVTIDDNPEFRALQGILSLQLEGNGQIWYRNVYLKPL